MADAAHAILTSDARELTGRLLLDEDVLRERTGRTDFSKYAPDAEGPLAGDFFVPDAVFERTDTKVTGMF
jgi:citronellol/citronellal dehydrogenase